MGVALRGGSFFLFPAHPISLCLRLATKSAVSGGQVAILSGLATKSTVFRGQVGILLGLATKTPHFRGQVGNCPDLSTDMTIMVDKWRIRFLIGQGVCVSNHFQIIINAISFFICRFVVH